ncbi:dynein assembly factor 1, axonemal homolog [Cyclospora cayetanensis]|uniref:Dynein assembly factor 1, axonemal homolog n=1 Tax=Cyclospora cayetanensis TaxID=88456 RepID=A0A6P6RTK7_9EIME|nr:dynein assembly factor 1, axonemal homolog [Cyclospora cayetanensis]
MAASRTHLSTGEHYTGVTPLKREAGSVVVGPILNAAKLKALLLADGSTSRKCKALDLSHNNIRKLDLSANQITNIMGLANTPLRFTLQALNLANNQIRDFKGLAPLTTFESLEALDLRGNPLSDFGVVAEGFALLCCVTLRKLNGRTISAEVRDAVDTWALEDSCGRATTATVQAFQEAMMHPEGPALFAFGNRSRSFGRVSNPNKCEDGTGDRKHNSASTTLVSASGSVVGLGLETRVSSSSKSHDAPVQGACVSSRLPYAGSESSRVAVTQNPSRDNQAAEELPLRVQNSEASTSSFPQTPVTAASEACRRTEDAEEECERCYSRAPKEQGYGQSGIEARAEEDGFDEVTSSPLAEYQVQNSVLSHSARKLRHSRGHEAEGARASCKLCHCTVLPYRQYYHRTRQQGGYKTRATNTWGPAHRYGGPQGCIRCCTGTQTPAGWMHPLELQSSTSSMSGASQASSDSGHTADLETEHSRTASVPLGEREAQSALPEDEGRARTTCSEQGEGAAHHWTGTEGMPEETSPIEPTEEGTIGRASAGQEDSSGNGDDGPKRSEDAEQTEGA